MLACFSLYISFHLHKFTQYFIYVLALFMFLYLEIILINFNSIFQNLILNTHLIHKYIILPTVLFITIRFKNYIYTILFIIFFSCLRVVLLNL